MSSQALIGKTGHIAIYALFLSVPMAFASPFSGSNNSGQRLAGGDYPGISSTHLDDDVTRMVEAQKSYDLAKLMTLSLSCRDNALKRSQVSKALFCNNVAYSAAVVLGDTRQMFSALSWTKQTGFPAKERAGGGASQFGNVFDKVDVVQLAKSIPPTEQHLVPGHAVLPYTNAASVTSVGPGGDMSHRAADLRTIPAVEVSVNQKRIQAVADTGIGYSVVMDQSHANALGIETLVRGLPPLKTLGQNPVGPDLRLGLAKELMLGPLSLHNVIVLIAPSGNVTTDRVAVGLPLLARLKQFSFEESGIVIGKPSRECKAPMPLEFVSSWNEDGKLVFDARADGQTVKASIDTGAAPPLIAGRSLQPVADAQAGASVAPVETRYLRVEVSGRTLSYDNAPIITSLPFPAFLVGAPILTSSDLQFDFGGPSLCIVQRQKGNS